MPTHEPAAGPAARDTGLIIQKLKMPRRRDETFTFSPGMT